ncbi:MAG: mechanosensitive ion channel family protein [Candidatus Binatia bacterium]
MEETGSKLLEVLTTYGLSVLAAAAIFIVGKWIAGVFARLIERGLAKTQTDPTLAKFVKNFSYIAMMTFVIIAAVSKLGVQTTSFIAVIGAAGLAVGLALQGALSNFAAGVLIILFRPFKVGDFIQAGGTMGTVLETQIFNTVLAHPDNRKQFVPNAQILGGVITNFSAVESRRVDLVVGISYEDDLVKAKQVLERVVTEQTGVLKEPVPQVAVSELGNSSVDFVVRPWVKPEDYWDVRFKLTEHIKLALDEQGITIPYPQRTLHIKTGTLPEGADGDGRTG